MSDPIFWLGLSILLVAISLTALLTVAIPAFNEMGRAARSAEKLFDTLNRELPPTLEALRITGNEVTELTDDMAPGVQSASQVVKQVDQTITGVKQQAQKAQTTGRSVFVGLRAAWRAFNQVPSKSRRAARIAASAERRAQAYSSEPYPSDRNGNHLEDLEQPVDFDLNYEWEDQNASKPSDSPEPTRLIGRRDAEG